MEKKLITAGEMRLDMTCDEMQVEKHCMYLTFTGNKALNLYCTYNLLRCPVFPTEMWADGFSISALFEWILCYIKTDKNKWGEK